MEGAEECPWAKTTPSVHRFGRYSYLLTQQIQDMQDPSEEDLAYMTSFARRMVSALKTLDSDDFAVDIKEKDTGLFRMILQSIQEMSSDSKVHWHVININKMAIAGCISHIHMYIMTGEKRVKWDFTDSESESESDVEYDDSEDDSDEEEDDSDEEEETIVHRGTRTRSAKPVHRFSDEEFEDDKTIDDAPSDDDEEDEEDEEEDDDGFIDDSDEEESDEEESDDE